VHSTASFQVRTSRQDEAEFTEQDPETCTEEPRVKGFKKLGARTRGSCAGCIRIPAIGSEQEQERVIEEL
jgi:hypothetical protein